MGTIGETLRFRLGLVAAAAILAALAMPMVHGRVYVANDLGDFHLPLRQHYAGCLASGDGFAWTPSLFCGFDVHGEGQVGMYHPLHLLLYGLLPLGAAFNLEMLSSYVALLAGTYFFLRRWRLPRDASMLGGLIFAFGGFNLVHYMHLNAVAIVAHAPWLLLGIDVALRDPDPRRAAMARLAVGLLTASELLLGYPQYVWLVGLAEATYCAGLAPRTAGGLRRLAGLAWAKGLGVLAGAVQVVPTAMTLASSGRSSLPRFMKEMGSLPPANLIQALAPYLYEARVVAPPTMIGEVPFGPAANLFDWRVYEFGLYNGAMVPALIAWLVPRWRAIDAGRLARAAAALAVLALVLAFGNYTPLFEVTSRLPGPSLFRVPARHLALLHLASAILAALAFADLSRRSRLRPVPWPSLVPLLAVPAASVAIFLGARALARAWPETMLRDCLSPAPRALAGTGLLIGATALVALAARGHRLALAGILAFAAADEAYYGLTFLGNVPTSTPSALADSRPGPPIAAGERVRVPDNVLTMRGARLVDGYVGLPPARELDYSKPACLRLAGARWNSSAPGSPCEPVADPMPRARLIPKAVEWPTPNTLVDRIDLRTTALVPKALRLQDGPPGAATVLVDRPGKLRVAAAAPTRQLLVTTERFDGGWRAAVDGRPRRAARVYGDFLGCVVEEGDHRVDFRFRPRGLDLGGRLSLLGLALLAATAWASRFRPLLGRRHDPAATPAPEAADETWPAEGTTTGEAIRSRAAMAAMVAILAAFAMPMAMGRVHAANDLGTFHLPLRHFYAQCLARGDDFAWFPGIFCGLNLHGEGQLGMYHPLHLLLYAALPLGVAFQLELLSSYVLLLAGMFLFLRRWRLPKDASALGALVFAFGGYNFGHYVHMNSVAIIAHLPWLLLAIDVLLRDADPRRAARAGLGAGLLTASELLLGHPQSVWFSAMVEVSYVVFLLAAHRGEARRLPRLGWAIATGVLAGAVQLLPTMEAWAGSHREALSTATKAMGSLPPANLLQAIAPYLYTTRVIAPTMRSGPVRYGPATSIGDWRVPEFGLYNGAIVPAMLAWLLIRRREIGDRPLARGASALAILALLLALGKYSPLFRVTSRLPGLSLFRLPARYLVFYHLATAVLAALAFADLSGPRRGKRLPWRSLSPLLALPVASLAVAVGARGLATAWPETMLRDQLATTWQGLAGVALVGGASLLVILAARGHRPALLGIVLFASADEAAYGLTFARSAPPMTISALVASRPAPPASATVKTGRIRAFDNVLTLDGARLVDGYVALVPRRALDYDRPAALRVAGASWAVDRPDADDWRPVPAPLPRARLVAKAVATPTPARDLDKIDPATTALVTAPIRLEDGPTGSATIAKDRPGMIQVVAEATTRQLLVLNERHDRGWRVRVDGRDGEVVRTNGDFLGCVVEAGTHRVTFRYRPWSRGLGGRLSLIGLGLMAATAWAAFGGKTGRRAQV